MTAFHESPSSGPTAALAAEMQALIPVLETKRLILRAPRIEDFDVFAEAAASPRGRYYGDYENREGAWSDFMQLTGTWLLRGHGAWTIIGRDTGEIFGFVHIGAEPGDQEPELGFIVTEEAEGRGIAFEAAAAVRDHAFGPFALDRLVSYVDSDNTRSRALAQRLGGVRDTNAEAAHPDHDRPLIFRHEPEKKVRP